MLIPHSRCLVWVTLVFSTLIAGCEKFELDRRLNDLCKVDGGVRVYETVNLPPEMFDSTGRPFPPELRKTTASGRDGNVYTIEERWGSEYKRVWKTITLKKGEPMKGEGELTRHEEKFFRTSDGKLLGEFITYGRSGGDFILAGAHPSSRGCQIGNHAASRIFLMKNK